MVTNAAGDARIAVFGTGGRLGRILVVQALQNGHNVRAVVH
jgi:putative NADH-flavin reductase